MLHYKDHSIRSVRKIADIFPENHKKHINEFCGENVDYFNV
jgi:hypothetical protein